MKHIHVDDLECLALGSAVLGSGGGGDPTNQVPMVSYAMETFGPVILLDINEVPSHGLVVPVGMMGAPLVLMEKLPSSREFIAALSEFEKTLGCKTTAIMPLEIGGTNAFVPLLIAGELGLPVVNADTIGRAFPQLQMTSCNLAGIPCAPAILADSLGNTCVIKASSPNTTEHLARHVAVGMGSSCALTAYPMKGCQLAKSTIPGSYDLAMAIGRTILRARQESQSPITRLIEKQNARLLAVGTITDVDQQVKDGFLQGTVTLHTSQGTVQLVYQNEYLLAKRDDAVLATTPDILMLLESESGSPLTTELLKFGLRVSLIVLPAPSIWRTPAGMELVGPHVFGHSNL